MRVGRRWRLSLIVIGSVLVASCSSSQADHDQLHVRAHHHDQAQHPAHAGRIDAASVMGKPDRVIAGPQGAVGQFFVECDLSHVASDDPIVFPGTSGASHVHAFFGNVSTTADSTVSNLLGRDTTCDDTWDTAAYWVPTLIDEGRVIPPDFGVAYYRAGLDVDPLSVQPYPAGLVMIAGDPMATSAQPAEVVGWSCGHGSRRLVEPPSCPFDTEVRLTVTFPDCWDGKNLDRPGHREHMRYSSRGACPKGHPIPVPQLVFAVEYPVSGDISHMLLSSGTVLTGHADFINSWDQTHLEKEVDLCIRRNVACGVSSGRRPI